MNEATYRTLCARYRRGLPVALTRLEDAAVRRGDRWIARSIRALRARGEHIRASGGYRWQDDLVFVDGQQLKRVSLSAQTAVETALELPVERFHAHAGRAGCIVILGEDALAATLPDGIWTTCAWAEPEDAVKPRPRAGRQIAVDPAGDLVATSGGASLVSPDVAAWWEAVAARNRLREPPLEIRAERELWNPSLDERVAVFDEPIQAWDLGNELAACITTSGVLWIADAVRERWVRARIRRRALDLRVSGDQVLTFDARHIGIYRVAVDPALDVPDDPGVWPTIEPPRALSSLTRPLRSPGHRAPIIAIAHGDDASFTGDETGLVAVWTGNPASPRGFLCRPEGVAGLAVRPDLLALATGRAIELWNRADGSLAARGDRATALSDVTRGFAPRGRAARESRAAGLAPVALSWREDALVVEEPAPSGRVETRYERRGAQLRPTVRRPRAGGPEALQPRPVLCGTPLDAPRIAVEPRPLVDRVHTHALDPSGEWLYAVTDAALVRVSTADHRVERIATRHELLGRRHALDILVFGSPTRPLLVAGADGGYLAAFDLRDGARLWHHGTQRERRAAEGPGPWLRAIDGDVAVRSATGRPRRPPTPFTERARPVGRRAYPARTEQRFRLYDPWSGDVRTHEWMVDTRPGASWSHLVTEEPSAIGPDGGLGRPCAVSAQAGLDIHVDGTELVIRRTADHMVYATLETRLRWRALALSASGHALLLVAGAIHTLELSDLLAP